MPELPEIEVLYRDLEKEVGGRRLKDVTIRPGANAMKVVTRHSKRKEFQELLDGAKIETVRRVERKLLLDMDNAQSLVLDLGPTARFVKTSASDPVVPHTHILVGFTIGGQLRFIDPEKQGEVYVIPTEEAETSRLKGSMLDPLEDQIAWQQLSGLLDERDAPMKAVMRDESFIGGLGDLYADEVLWNAGVLPAKSSSRLSSQDVRRLSRALAEVMQEAVKARGTSLGEDGFVDLAGQPGTYQDELKVYDQAGASCRRCRNTIVEEEVAGFRTFFCPRCQS